MTRFLRPTLIFLLTFLLALVVYRAGRLGYLAWQTNQHVAALTTPRAAASWPTDWRATAISIDALADTVATLDADVQPLAPLLGALQPLPGYGATLAAMPALAGVTRQATRLAQRFTALATAAGDAAATPASFLAAAGPRLPALAPDLDALAADLAALPPVDAPESLARFVQQAPGLATLAAEAARLGPRLGWLLGMDAPRTYLVLVQNNHELRATGGFIAAFGRVVVDQGRLVDLDVVDSYQVYSDQSEYGPAPAPMLAHMGIELQVARDANWSPNLPTAAPVVRRLYTQDTGVPIDGILTVDLNTIRHLIGAFGELRVPGLPEPLTAANVEAQLIRLWEQPLSSSEPGGGDWWSQRKDFMPLVAEAAIARTQSGAVDPAALGAAVAAALADRSAQLWVSDPSAQQVFAAAGWDGGLHPQAGADFLAVVDSNLGYNKVDAVIQRGVDYAVRWPDGPDAPALATLTLTYTHPITATDPGCDPSPRYGAGYAALIKRCYFDYVRVYAPAGSRLIDVDGMAPETVTSEAGEAGTQRFGGFFILPPNNRQVVTWTYRLPAGLTPDSYALIVQRQSGTAPLPITLDIGGKRHSTLLSGSRLVLPSPP